MNSFSRRTRLSVCALEDRTAPAISVLVQGGILTLTDDGASDTVVVTADANNLMAVTVNGANAGSYTATNGLVVNLGSGDDTLTFDLNGNTTSLLNVALRGGLGNDSIEVSGGTLHAGLVIDGGLGNNSLTIGGATVNGPQIQVGGLGLNTVLLGGATITGSTLVTRATSLNLGGTNFNGNLTISNVLPSTTTTVFSGNTIKGNVLYRGGVGIDQVSFGGVTSNGGITLRLGDGNNSVSFDPGNDIGFTSITAGKGNNTIATANGGTIGGLSISLGDGNNALSFVGQMDGDVFVRAGKGNDSISMGTFLNVAGNFELHLGDGNNSLSGDGNVGGALIYMAGNGVNTLNLSSSTNSGYAIVVVSGAGNDSFTFTHTTGNFDPASFDINLGKGKNTFNVVNTTITWPSRVLGI